MKNTDFKNIKVIKYENLPARFSVIQIICLFTCLHYWDAPEWVFGAFGLLFTLDVILQIIKLRNQNYIDLDK